MSSFVGPFGSLRRCLFLRGLVCSPSLLRSGRFSLLVMGFPFLWISRLVHLEFAFGVFSITSTVVITSLKRGGVVSLIPEQALVSIRSI